MDSELLGHIAGIINWTRTWIAFRSYDEYREIAVNTMRGIRLTTCRVFTLEVRIGLYGFKKGDVIAIPLSAIKSEVKRLSKDKVFKRRVQMLKLTHEDINNLFNSASNGLIDLDLEN